MTEKKCSKESPETYFLLLENCRKALNHLLSAVSLSNKQKFAPELSAAVALHHLKTESLVVEEYVCTTS